MARRYWLMKSEPDAFSMDDLIASDQQTAPWDGVRNYQARNFMRDEMKPGDGVFFYHSRTQPLVIAGTMEVSSKPYPDPTQFDPDSKYFDAKSSKEQPRWFLVDVTFTAKFEPPITRDQLKQTPGLEDMMVLQKGSRLSIQPVTEQEWIIIHQLAGKDPK
ncbi:EVE domain-containing protein [Balneolaceae bacterium ANBcel3]|nr:EVE domain-containing protein [Balneolaceae bacterium ANBcel3]